MNVMSVIVYAAVSLSLSLDITTLRLEPHLLAVVEGRRGEAAEHKQGLVFVVAVQSGFLRDAPHTLLRLHLQYGLHTMKYILTVS